MNKKKILTIILAVIAVAAIAVVTIVVTKPKQADTKGTITIEVIALDESVVASKQISYEPGTTLISMIESNFTNVRFESGMIYDIETLVTPSDWSTYITILQNDVESATGINDIVFVSGDKITLKMVVNPYA